MWTNDMLRELVSSTNQSVADQAKQYLHGSEAVRKQIKADCGGFFATVLTGDVLGAWCRADGANRVCIARLLGRYGVYDLQYVVFGGKTPSASDPGSVAQG